MDEEGFRTEIAYGGGVFRGGWEGALILVLSFNWGSCSR